MAFPPEVLLNSDHHHETLVNLALKKCIKAKEGYFFFFFGRERNIPNCCCKTIWLLILFILVCGVLFPFVTFKRVGQEKGRFQMEADNWKATAPGFEAT